MASKVGLNKDFTEGTSHNFSFEEWLSTSGLTALKDILLKHKMTSLETLSTESTEFAAFISDPLLLPRAMLIPQAIQSMQHLQTTYNQSIDGTETETKKTEETVAQKHDNSVNSPSIDEDIKVIDDQPQEGGHNNYDIDSDVPPSQNNHNPLLIDCSDDDFKVSKPTIIREEQQTKTPKSINQSQPAKKKKAKRKMVQLKVGDYVKWTNDKKKQGIVRFIGEVEFDEGCFYGIELKEGNGNCDGSIDDVEYFECNPNEGIFVKRKLLRKIKPPTKVRVKRKKKVSKKNGKKIKKRRVKHSKSATLGAMDITSVYGDRPRAYSATKRKDDNYYKKMRESMKKAGPREIGRNKYKGIKTSKKKRKDSSEHDMQSLSRSASYTSAKIHKAGPRDIGRIKYNGLKLSKKEKAELEGTAFLADSLSHKTRKRKKTVNEEEDNMFGAKLGPQEIGRNKYKGTKLSKKQKEELKAGKVLEERVHHKIKKNKDRHHRSKSLIGSKLGPVEMGKIKGYKGTKMDYNSESECDDNMLVEKTHIVIKKKWGVKNLEKINIDNDDDDDLLNDFEYGSESAYDSDQHVETPKSARTSTPKKERKKNKKKKKAKKKKKKKKVKKESFETVNKYKKKLNSSRRHYASESDQEYVENMKGNVKEIEKEQEEEEQEVIVKASTMPHLVQSESLSPKGSSLIADDENKEEIVHIVHDHIDTSEASDSDFSDNGSLNALSSSEEEDGNDDGDENGSKGWI